MLRLTLLMGLRMEGAVLAMTMAEMPGQALSLCPLAVQSIRSLNPQRGYPALSTTTAQLPR